LRADLLGRFGTLSELMGRPLGELACVRGIKAARAVAHCGGLRTVAAPDRTNFTKAPDEAARTI